MFGKHRELHKEEKEIDIEIELELKKDIISRDIWQLDNVEPNIKDLTLDEIIEEEILEETMRDTI